MDHSNDVVITAIENIDLDQLKYLNSKNILTKQIVSDVINYYPISWEDRRSEFITMLEYLCEIHPTIIFKYRLMEIACKNNFFEYAQFMFDINVKNKVLIEYDFGRYFMILCKATLIDINFIAWIHYMNKNNIFGINYNDAFVSVAEYPENYRIVEWFFQLDKELINFPKIFKYECKNQNINVMNIIHKKYFLTKKQSYYQKFYTDCYYESIFNYLDISYKWLYEIPWLNQIYIGNSTQIFINLCNINDKFAKLWTTHYPNIDISHNEYNCIYKLCLGNNIDMLHWVMNKYYVPPSEITYIFYYALISYDACIYKYFYNNHIKNKIPNIFNNLDVVIPILLKNDSYSVLSWITNQTDEYRFHYNIDTKTHEFIKNNGIYDLAMNCKLYKNTETIYECDVCMNDERIYFVKFDCNHLFCNECSIRLSKCPMCLKIINKENITLLETKKN
jgi:hypothetical protein